MKTLSPVKAIRSKCLDCSADQPSEVRYCQATDCSIYPYRFGKNPNRKGIGDFKGGFNEESSTEQQIS